MRNDGRCSGQLKLRQLTRGRHRARRLLLRRLRALVLVGQSDVCTIRRQRESDGRPDLPTAVGHEGTFPVNDCLFVLSARNRRSPLGQTSDFQTRSMELRGSGPSESPLMVTSGLSLLAWIAHHQAPALWGRWARRNGLTSICRTALILSGPDNTLDEGSRTAALVYLADARCDRRARSAPSYG
jgi:hypothetical protein